MREDRYRICARPRAAAVAASPLDTEPQPRSVFTRHGLGLGFERCSAIATTALSARPLGGAYIGSLHLGSPEAIECIVTAQSLGLRNMGELMP
jgi:hypothetical protein